MTNASNIFASYEPLECKVCGKDLLAPDQEGNGIVVFERDPQSDKYIQCYAVCKGDCDDAAKLSYVSAGNVTDWEDVSDLQIPYLFLKEVFSVINGLQDGTLVFEANSLDELKGILMRISQLALRNQSAKELERIKSLAQVPWWP